MYMVRSWTAALLLDLFLGVEWGVASYPRVFTKRASRIFPKKPLWTTLQDSGRRQLLGIDAVILSRRVHFQHLSFIAYITPICVTLC